MLSASLWLLAAAILIGIGLAALWLQGHRPAGWARLAAPLHGLAAAAGTALLLAFIVGGAADPQNFGHLTAWFLGIALAGGTVIVVSQLRRRRPAGLVVALHASLGLAGFVLLLAYANIRH